MTYPPQTESPAPVAAVLHRTHRRRKTSPVAFIGDGVLIVCAIFLVVVIVRGPIASQVTAYNRAAAANAAMLAAPVEPRRVLETLGPNGQAIARYELEGEPRMLAGGVVTFRTRDGRRLFASGLWRVIEGGRP